MAAPAMFSFSKAKQDWPYHCEPPLDTCKHIELKAKYSLRSKPFILQIRTKIGLILMAVLKL